MRRRPLKESRSLGQVLAVTGARLYPGYDTFAEFSQDAEQACICWTLPTKIRFWLIIETKQCPQQQRRRPCAASPRLEPLLWVRALFLRSSPTARWAKMSGASHGPLVAPSRILPLFALSHPPLLLERPEDMSLAVPRTGSGRRPAMSSPISALVSRRRCSVGRRLAVLAVLWGTRAVLTRLRTVGVVLGGIGLTGRSAAPAPAHAEGH